MTETQQAVIEWLANGHTGLSSETMAFWLTFQVKKDESSHPWDSADFDRCLRLLDKAPQLRLNLHRMSDLSPAWAKLVARWEDIERQHLDEVGLGWTKAKRAPLTCALMKAVLM